MALLLLFWRKWEFLYRKVFHVVPLDSLYPDYIFYISKHRYLGKTISNDEFTIRPLDWIVEIHLNNEKIREILTNNPNQLSKYALFLVSETKKALPVLAKRLSEPEFDQVNVVLGITLITRAIEHFGFQSFSFKNSFVEAYFSRYLKWVFYMVNPQAKEILKKSKKEKFIAKIVAMNKEKLMKRYLN